MRKAMLYVSLFVSLFIGGGVVAAGSPAQAAPSSVISVQTHVQADSQGTVSAQAASQGPAGYLTFWDGCGSSGVGFCGATWALTPAGGLNVCHALPTGADNHPSAFSNQSGHNFRVWTGGGCTGSSAILYNGTESGDIDDPFNNSISSQQRVS